VHYSPFKLSAILIIALISNSNIFALRQLDRKNQNSKKFATALGGISKAEKIFNTASKLLIDQQADCLKLSGIATLKTRSTKYLGVRLTLTKALNMTGKVLSFKMTGDAGDLYVRLYNENNKKACWNFKGYNCIKPSPWKLVNLQPGNDGILRWDSRGISGKKAKNINRIDFVYRPKTINKQVVFKIKNMGLKDIHIPKFQRIKSKTLKLNDLKSGSKTTTLISNNSAIAKVIVPSGKLLTKRKLKALKLLNKNFNVDFSLYKVKKGQMTLPKGNYILFGDGVKGLLVNRLKSLHYIVGGQNVYEVRNIRNAFQKDCNILYFGGSSDEKLLEGVKHFIRKNKMVKGNLAVGKYYDSEEYNSSSSASREYYAAALAKINQIYANKSLWRKNMDAIRVISNVARKYNNTGDEKLIKLFMQLMTVFRTNYESSKTWRKTPPSFRAQELAFAIDLVDESSDFSNQDKVFCGNVLRQITEDCMNYYEMREPIMLYNAGKTAYLTNHPIFASRSVSAMGRYLQKSFNIPAANYWIAVSDNAYKEIASADQGPEDAGNYQWMCRRLYNDYALQSGSLPLLTPNLKQYIDFAIAHFNQMGLGADYGDSPPFQTMAPIHFPIAGYKFFDDKLSGHIINSVKTNSFVLALTRKMGVPKKLNYSPRMLGLTVFPIADSLKNYYKVTTSRKLLNKAVFRSGYEPDDEYLMLGGINSPNYHGHLDANAIIQYSRGDRYWLIDGDYIKAFPREHNSMIISRNATVPDQRRIAPFRQDSFAELECSASAPDGSQGISVTTLRKHAGMNWTRNIFWSSLNGFWVIDQLKAQEAGNYVIKCIWRTLGEVSVNKETIKIKQKKSINQDIPHHMFIARGDEATTTIAEQLDYAHGGPFGYYDSYKFAAPTTKVISETNEITLNKGGQIDYVNFLETLPGDKPKPPQVRKAGSSSWVVNGSELQLVVIGELNSPSIKLKAERALVSRHGIIAIKASKLQIGKQAIDLPNKANFYGSFGKGKLKNIKVAQIKKILQDIYNKSSITKLRKTSNINVPELSSNRVINTHEDITAMSIADNKIVCGLSNGDVIAYDTSGNKLWQTKVKAQVKALCPVKNDNKTFWAVGTGYDNRKSKKGCVALISDQGKLCWQQAISPYHSRPGTIRTIIAAKLMPGKNQQIVAGSEAWKYIAFDLTGKKLWTFPVLHSATVSAAADMTGNGLDEVALGTEYPYHWIVDGKGKKLKTVLSSPGDWSVLTTDITMNSKQEVVWGREDGYIKVMRPGNLERKYLWSTNVGGLPTGIVALPDGELAVSTSNNAVVFVNRFGVKKDILYFPGFLYDLKKINGYFYTICRDGYIYKFTDSKIVGKFKIQDFKINLLLPFIASVKHSPVIAFGRHVTILK
jgi:putative pyrroloquinoline-quinone binding quinoprotein